MVLFGLILIFGGALLILAGIFTADQSASSQHVQLLGIDISPVALFVLGVVAGVAVLWGFGILKFGTRRSLRQRKERKRLEELSQKLDSVEQERREDGDDTHPHA